MRWSKGSRLIPLSRGAFSVVDAGDYNLLSKYDWQLQIVGRVRYAVRSTKRTDGCEKRTIYMHRMLMQPPVGINVDHINNNGLDNRRANLRLATHSKNAANSLRALSPISGYPGVYRNHDRWGTKLKVNNRLIYLGTFDSPKEAFNVYRKAHIYHHGAYSIYFKGEYQ